MSEASIFQLHLSKQRKWQMHIMHFDEGVLKVVNAKCICRLLHSIEHTMFVFVTAILSHFKYIRATDKAIAIVLNWCFHSIGTVIE